MTRRNKPLREAFYKNRFTLLSLVVIVAMFVILMLYDKAEKLQEQSQVSGGVVKSTGQPEIGGAFSLTDFNGKSLTHNNLEGQFSLIFFGFTYCPDVCPTTLAKLANIYDGLDRSLQDKLQVLFVSVDSARDDPESLKNYVTAFHPEFLGATGTRTQLDEMTKKYLAYYAIRDPENPNDPANYLVDHSSFIYLMGPDGEYITHFGHTTDQTEISSKLRQILFN